MQIQENEIQGALFKVYQIIRNTNHLKITLTSKNKFATPCHFNAKFPEFDNAILF